MFYLWQNKWTIKARVTSKGDVRTWNKSTGSGKLFSMDLMDESGAIRVMPFTGRPGRSILSTNYRPPLKSVSV